MDLKTHWERIYRTRSAGETSWFQPHARLSLELILAAGLHREARILDVGGGASTLADDLLAEGYRQTVVVDLAIPALFQAGKRLDPAGDRISRAAGDVLALPIASGSIDLWHDRALLHFLTDPAYRARYVLEVCQVVRPGGWVLVATFAEDGPTSCSGLPVSRYDPEGLHAVFGGGFRLLKSHRELHTTPTGGCQPFTYCLFAYVSADRPRPSSGRSGGPVYGPASRSRPDDPPPRN